MRLFLLAIMSICAFGEQCHGETVTFLNRTGNPVFVRCISGGAVDPNDEFRETIPAGHKHFRTNFAAGKRAAVAWKHDRSQCTVIPFEVKHGMTLTIEEDANGVIYFLQPCEVCAGSSTVQNPVKDERPFALGGRQWLLRSCLACVILPLALVFWPLRFPTFRVE